MGLSHYAKQLGAFTILVVVQATAILLFKLCQQDGKYTFNPASSVALTEVCKLVLAFSLHYQYVQSAKKPFWEGVSVRTRQHLLTPTPHSCTYSPCSCPINASCACVGQPKIVVHYLGLSTLYTFNNQLSFYCLEVADPGSMALGKSVRKRS